MGFTAEGRWRGENRTASVYSHNLQRATAAATLQGCRGPGTSRGRDWQGVRINTGMWTKPMSPVIAAEKHSLKVP